MTKSKERGIQLDFGFEVDSPKIRRGKSFEPSYAKAKIESEHGHIYISYPAGTTGERMPCVFCPGAQAESLRTVGKPTSQMRYLCTVQENIFSTSNLRRPKNCPLITAM